MPNRITRALAAPLAAILCVTLIAPAQAQRRAAPAQEHAQIVQQFGGEVGGTLGQLADQIGARLAARAGNRVNPDFTVLNSPVANAFATPSGRVYVTRQLLAIMNSEDELAFVLGHEAGHIAARHSQSRQNTGLLTQILSGLANAVTGSNLAGQLLGAVGQQYLLSFSRNQELESDRLGVRYVAENGYDPTASADILEALADYNSQLTRFSGREDAQRSTPSWNSTHPNSAQRVAQVRREAQALRRFPVAPNRERLLAAIDGMVFDDDPRQGIIEGSSFRHPDLRFAFDAPQGYGIQNGARAVSVSGGQGQAIFSTGAYNGRIDQFAMQALQSVVGQQGQVQADQPQLATINGLRSAVTSARVRTQGGSADLTVVAYEFSPSQAYYLATLTPAGSGVGPYRSTVQSVRRLSAQEAGSIRPRVIDVVTVGRTDTVDTLARRMAYPSLQTERFRVLNGLAVGELVQPGQRVKIVVYGTPTRS